MRPSITTRYDISSLKAFARLAGNPLDEPGSLDQRRDQEAHCRQLPGRPETGWPIMTLCNGVEPQSTRFGSPGKAVYGYNVKLIDDAWARG